MPDDFVCLAQDDAAATERNAETPENMSKRFKWNLTAIRVSFPRNIDVFCRSIRDIQGFTDNRRVSE